MEYRRSLAASFLFRFFVDVALKLEKEGSGYKAADWLPAGHESAAVHFERPASQGVQYFNKVGEQNVVGQPVRHMAADLQARPQLCLHGFGKSPFHCAAQMETPEGMCSRGCRH